MSQRRGEGSYSAVPLDEEAELNKISDEPVTQPAVSKAPDAVVVSSAPAPAAAPAANAASKPASPEGAIPWGAVAFWIFMSCSVILFNKALYGGSAPGTQGVFRYPLSLTCIHMAFASASTWGLRFLGYIDNPKFGWSVWGKNVMPIGVLYALSLATSNLGAARLSVSFVQMIKALTPLVALGVGILFAVEKADKRQTLIVATMCLGVIVASYGELLWDTAGVFFQVTSVAAEGARLVITQILLQQHLPKSNPLVSISIFAPPCFALLLPIALSFESGAFAKVLEPSIGMTVLLNTLTAFVLNLAVVVLVQKSSGLVLTLAGIVKDIALIVASIFIFANPVTPIQVIGYTLALIGLNMYNDYKTKKNDMTVGMRELMRTAVTNKQAVFIVVGAIVLYLVSDLSLSAYYEDQKQHGGSGASEEEESAGGARRLLATLTAGLGNAVAEGGRELLTYW